VAYYIDPAPSWVLLEALALQTGDDFIVVILQHSAKKSQAATEVSARGAE
jgi:hypothetical protein